MQNIVADLMCGSIKESANLTGTANKAAIGVQFRVVSAQVCSCQNSALMTFRRNCTPLVAFLISAVPTALAAWSFRASRREKRVRFVKGGARAGVVSATRHKTGKGILTFGTHVFSWPDRQNDNPKGGVVFGSLNMAQGWSKAYALPIPYRKE